MPAHASQGTWPCFYGVRKRSMKINNKFENSIKKKKEVYVFEILLDAKVYWIIFRWYIFVEILLLFSLFTIIF